MNKIFALIDHIRSRSNQKNGLESKVVAGCVAECNPKYLAQALRLVQSLRWFGGQWAEIDFHICLIEHDSPEYREKFASYHAQVHVVPRFSTVHPPSNKLRFLQLPQLAAADRVVLFDCDTVIVQDPSHRLTGADFMAKIADVPTVPHAVFADLFNAYEIPLPRRHHKCSVHGESVIPYFNAGVLSFSRKAISTLVPAWIKMNESLIEQIHLLGDHANFCEQASLSLALQQCGTRYQVLGNECNFPAHFQEAKSNSAFQYTDPAIIHYHWLVDDEGYLLRSPYRWVDKRIQEFNKRLRQANRQHLNNRTFWNNRYSSDPELGSGLGSRGATKIYKRSLIGRIAHQLQPLSTLDVGCGDMAVGEMLPEAGYTGVDVADVIINANQDRYPNRQFVQGDLAQLELKRADLVVCLDVLIHLHDTNYYRQFVQKLVWLAQGCGIVAGYESPPQTGSDITYYHEPLSATLKRVGAENVQIIGGYRQVSIFKFGLAAGTVDDTHVYKDCGLHKPVFLVGTMRSGTTLLAELLDLSPHVRHCPFELKDIWSRETGVPMASPKTGDHFCPQQSAEDASQQQAEPLIKAFAERARNCSGKSQNSTFLNKNPHLCNKLPWVRGLFPEARFIWIHRHMPQVVVSLLRLFEDVRRRQKVVHIWPLRKSPDERRCWEVYLYDQVPANIPADRIFPGGNLNWLFEYWLESNLAVKEFMLASPHSVLEIDEALLLANPRETLARCLAHMELPLLSDEVKLINLEKERNESWRNSLTQKDLVLLSGSVETHRKAIDRLFDDVRIADMYRDWMQT